MILRIQMDWPTNPRRHHATEAPKITRLDIIVGEIEGRTSDGWTSGEVIAEAGRREVIPRDLVAGIRLTS
jgi:hypothetical protein